MSKLKPSPLARVSRRAALKTGLITLAAAPVLRGWFTSTVRAANAPKPVIGPAVVTVDSEADAAANAALQAGGNAVDAAIAAMLVLGVLYPDLTGIGGYGGSMVIYLAKKNRVTSIDFDSRAPLAFKPELFPDGETAFHGYRALGVPGVAAGFDLALKKFGRLSWKQVAERARQIATDGFMVDTRLAGVFKDLAKQMDAASFKAYFPDGHPPEVGAHWVQKDLASLFTELGEHGAKAFYHGDIAEKILRQVKENGGLLSKKDFDQFKAQEVAPSKIDYRGHQVHTAPPPSGGLTALSIMKTLEQFDVPNLKPWGAEYFHLYAQASKLCWAERFGQFGDPDSAGFSPAELMSVGKAKERAQLIRDGKVPNIPAPAVGPKHTANVVIVDREGNMVSMTATQGGSFGSRVVIAGLGLVLGHSMSRFTLEPGSPNYPAPGKRMQHNMSPTVITKNGYPTAAFGLPGGRMIVSVTALLALGTLDFKGSAHDVVFAPRVHADGGEPINVSESMPEATATELAAMGHQLKRQRVAGPSNLAIIDPATGKIDSESGRAMKLEG